MDNLVAFLANLFSIDFWAAAVRFATPLLFAALGEIFSERAGVLNIGLEGMMLSGAFGGMLGAYYSGSPWIGLVVAMVAGGMVALIHALISVTIRGDQVVSGAAINIAVLGLTTFLVRTIFGVGQRPAVASFDKWSIPLLSDIPVLGVIFFQHIPLVYIGYLLIPISSFLLFRTTWGLKIRAVGEHPLAADTVGIWVAGWRYGMTVLCGVLAGIGGAFLSLGQLNMFLENMTAGRGFIALAAVIFGRWNPFLVSLAVALFGAADASTLRLQALNVQIPYQIVLMIPYLLTFLAFIGLVGRTVPPAALGRPYRKDER
ncbi:MAG: ABC transporter permease [Candidatus Micrarchaeaceae archaeon]